MEMIYDGHCGFCKRSMACGFGFRRAAADPHSRLSRTNPSPVVRRKSEQALYLVLPDGRALPGFEAYRYVVLRVPGLWWLVPFFLPMPVLSRLFGHPIYNWIAANRSRLLTDFGIASGPGMIKQVSCAPSDNSDAPN